MIEVSPNASPTDMGQSTLVWEAGGGDESMLYSTQASIEPETGNIWVADAGHNQFRIYSPEGDLVDTWGTSGSGDGQFNFIREANKQDSSWADIAFAADGSFYVTDAGNFRVQKFDRDRTFLLAWGEYGTRDGQFQDPLSVAVDGDGNVLVLDDYRDVIQKFTSDGDFLARYAAHGTNPGQLFFAGAMTVDDDGNIWVADWENHRVQKFGPDGAFQLGFGEYGPGNGQFNHPMDVAVGVDGTVYVADFDNGRIQAFDTSGHYRYQWTSAADNAMINPSGLEVAPNGDIYVVVFGRSRLQKYQVAPPEIAAAEVVAPIDASTPPQPSFSGADGASVELLWQSDGGPVELRHPLTIALAPGGNLWVLDGERNAFHIYGQDGTYLESWGTSGSGDGQFQFSRDPDNPDDNGGDILFAPDGSFFVADAGNHRIQKFDRDRNFVLAWGTDGSGVGGFKWLGSLLLYPNGELGVVDLSPISIEIYDQNGNFLRSSNIALDQPRVVDPSGAIWGVNENRIVGYSADGDVSQIAPDPNPADNLNHFFADMAVDGAGNLYIADPSIGRVRVYTSEGRLLLSWNGSDAAAGMLRAPMGIALDDEGNAYVLDNEGLTITKYRVTLP